MFKSLIQRQRFNFSQKVMVLFGAPGVGKGTFAKKLVKDLKFAHVSTGDEIRKILKGDVPDTFDKNLLKEIKEIVQSGGLVNDDIVVNIMKEKLKSPEAAHGAILDGVPRTLNQLKLQDEANIQTDLVVNLSLNQSILLEKLMGRRVCDTCGANFNLCNIQRDGYEMDPLLPSLEACPMKDESKCKLITRADDTEEVINNRMVEYEEKTAPLLNEYKKRNLTLDFEVKKGVKDYPKLLSLIQERL